MALTYLPDPLPDENFYSLVSRIALINGFSPHRQACLKLFGPSGFGSVTGCLIDWHRFCQFCCGFYGSTHKVLSQLTNHGYFCFLNWPARTQGRPEVFLGCYSPHQVPVSYLGKDGSYRWRFCKQCMASDLKRYGVSYWHRSHQLPSTFVCTTHLDVLHEIALQKIVRDLRLFLPSDTEIQNDAVSLPQPPFDPTTLLRLAVLGEEILATPLSKFKASEAVAAIRDASAGRGLATEAGNIRWVHATNDFERQYLRNQTLRGTSSKNNLSTSVLQALSGKYCKENWLARVMAIDWTLGSFEALSQRMLWLQSMNSNADTLGLHDVPPRRGAATDDDRERHRQICAEILSFRRCGGRTEVARRAYSTYRWLLRHDLEWFDAKCKNDIQTHQLQLF